MQYQLHDYETDAVILEGDKIIFTFPKGFHTAEGMRRKLIFTIDRGDCENAPLESFVYIRQRGRFGWKDISFSRFAALFKKGNMMIHDEYDSKLTNWKMIQLNANVRWSNIELFITDIANIECL